jgi:hypothetical protein
MPLTVGAELTEALNLSFQFAIDRPKTDKRHSLDIAEPGRFTSKATTKVAKSTKEEETKACPEPLRLSSG